MGCAEGETLAQCEYDTEIDAAKLALARFDNEGQPDADADENILPDGESEGLALKDDEPLDESECSADKLDDARDDGLADTLFEADADAREDSDTDPEAVDATLLDDDGFAD